MNISPFRIGKTLVAAGMAAISLTAWAADTVAPTLTATHTWIQKEGGYFRFNLLLDPQDDQGIQRLEVREKINATTIPANTPWREAVQNGIGDAAVPWKPEEPLTLEFNCSSMVLQVRAVDTSGNYSEVITRSYKSPFPVGPGPNLSPAFGSTPLNFTGSALDCRGLFTADFDGNGRDDLLVLDRTTGVVKVRRQNFDGTFTSNGFTVTAGSITDGAVADLNADGKPDIVVVVNNTVAAYENQGLDVNQTLQFQPMNLGGLATSGMSVVQHVVAVDLTGEGKPELIISGTGDGGLGGSGANLAVLINNDQFFLSAANNAVAPAGSSAGRMAAADFDADGDVDVAMLDESQKQILIFQNKGNSSFGAGDDVNVAERPLALKAGVSGSQSASTNPVFALAPQSLAVGDVSGDGRPDLIVTVHGYFGTGAPPNIVYRNMEMWQLFENRGGGGFQRWPEQSVSESAEAASEVTFRSDVLLQDLNKDRLPELVFTSQFGNGICAVRFMPWLNRQNQIQHFSVTPASVGAAANPQRLTAARFGVNSKEDIVVANGATNQLSWWFTTSNIESDKPIDLIGGASTKTDPNGTAGTNGTLSYTAYAGGVINYSVTCINNTANDLTGVTLECPLPKEVYFVSADAGYTSQYAGGVVTLRWTLDVPAGTSAVKSFAVEVNSTAKANTTLAQKMILKQGTKSLVSGTLPAVKVLGSDLHVFPTSFGQPWSFAFKPLYNPPAGAIMWMQGSFDGTGWFYLNASSMTRAGPFALEWNLSTSSVPVGCRYFRTAIVSHAADTGYSSVFGAFLPPTTGLKVSSKSPPKSGNTWTFSATQTSTAANLTVRFQSTETPYNEGSWTDLPMYAPTTRAGNIWTLNTYNVPPGQRYFRAISAAPGWVDSISSSFVGPVPVEASPPGLPPFTHWHIGGVQPAQGGQGEYAHQGDLITFIATTASVPGIKVRFQSKLHSDTNESAWTDLPEGYMQVAGTTWTFKTRYLPVGFRDFRAISSAPGYTDNTTLLYKGVSYSTVFAFLVKEPRLPQIPTIFGTFDHPANGSLQITGVNFPVSIDLFDFNGVQRVYLEAGKPGAALKEVPGTNMTNTSGVTYSTNVTFTGAGQLTLRVAVVDGFDPSQICRSEEVTITVGPGGGTSSPTIGSFSNTLTQATLKTRGSIKIKTLIGDDKQVYRAFVHRTDANGDYISTVGEMTRAAAKNPSDFTCIDGNLSDGTYYYRVVAHDYDGNETIKFYPFGYTISTPVPPPDPITLDVAENSRLLVPTLPTTKFNYSYIPYADSGMLEFSYSGLPTGTNRFVVYRTDLSPDRPYWEQTVTKTSGVIKTKAPYWTTDSSHPNAGEGIYRIVCFQGSTEIPHGSGVNTFRVGHAWNLPNTFTTVDFGLYWFKDVKNGLRGVDAAQNDDYFDPNKPTVIYVHGWQPGEVKVERRESWLRQDPYKDATTYDMCAVWKKQGYNVGMFNWNQFGDGDLLFSQANIYYIATENGLPAGHSMIYSTRNADGSSSRHFFADGEGDDIENCTVVDLLLGELQRCLGSYTPTANKEFRMIGHSLGTQVVGRTCDAIRNNPGWGIPLPTRVSLLELAQINGLDPTGLDIPAIQKGYITGLANAGVAIDCYQSTDLQSLLGVNLAFVGDIHDMAAYARWRPDYIQPLKVGLDVFQKSHNEIVRWYMQSFDYNEFPAFTYWAPFTKRDAVGKSLSASTTNTRVRNLMGGQYYYEQSEGKNTATITDDQFERKNR